MIHFSGDPSPLLMSVSGMVDPILVSCQTALALLSFVSIGQGTASAIVERREFVVQSEEDWKKLWTGMRPTERHCLPWISPASLLSASSRASRPRLDTRSRS